MKRVMLLIVLAAFAPPLWARTLYVSDNLAIHLRSAPDSHASIIEALDSGTPVSVLKKTHGYAEIEAPDGKRGWIRARDLQGKPAASDRLGKAQKALAGARQEHATLENKLKAALSAQSQQAATIKQMTRSNAALKQRLSKVTNASAHSLHISRQNLQLKAHIARLKQARSQLRSQDRVTESRRAGLLMGAAIIIAGILAGLILPLLLRIRRKRSAWQSF